MSTACLNSNTPAPDNRARKADSPTTSESDSEVCGQRLLRRTRPFASEDRGRTWRLLLITLLVFSGLETLIFLVPSPWIKLALAVPVGLVSIRMFIFYHDHLHGAILEGSVVGRWLMSLIGFYLLSVRSIWQETHDYHHRNNAKMVGSGIGSFPVVSTNMWRRMSTIQRRRYRLLRHPVTIFGGYFTVFIIGMALAPFRRNPKKHWGGPLSLLIHFAIVGLLSWQFGVVTALSALVLPLMIATGVGAYLFYAQHNFPEVKFFKRAQWTFHDAALRSSSMFDMPRWMHWLTGNIGYHHIHHLNHRIPFYRLPDVMESFPEFQDVGRTSWRPSDVKACLELDVWDPQKNQMVSLNHLQPSGSTPVTVQ